ncbi:hypothetical protein N9052_00630 [bacterium]|nr:hypothetical protein [bacterium]
MTFANPTMHDDVLFPALTLTERYGRRGTSMPMRCGLPLPKGKCFDHCKLSLVLADGTEVPASFEVTALWPDNSIQWCLVRSRIDLEPGQTLSLGLAKRLTVMTLPATKTKYIEDTDSELRLTLGRQTVDIDVRTFRLSIPNMGINGSISLAQDGTGYKATIKDYQYRTLLSTNGVLGVTINIHGVFELPQKSLRFDLSLELTGNEDQRIEGSLTLHNPAAANHPGGLWDLGDPESVFFDSLILTVSGTSQVEQSSGSLILNPNEPALDIGRDMRLTQHASGGQHWNSPVHVNHRGSVPMREPGYLLQLDGRELRGSRTDPLVQLRLENAILSARITDFWQRFPSELMVTPGQLDLGLLPNVDAAHELQPGERCTHRFSLLLSEPCEDSDTKDQLRGLGELVITLNPEYIQSCGLPELADPAQIDSRLQMLINEGLEGERSFLNKRESIDEYGWRNFGELWADHETDGYTGERLFVSHYNNQYDPLFGFIRQYLQSGDPRWFELANDLAFHNRDIDIYHTDQDRPEYNHGLFWHTDHYLEAATSSHRSYSRLQPADAYEGHARGGGPGGQHCYTSGLLYHYLLTGDTASRDALFGLRGWIECVYEGSGTLMDVVLAVKNRHRPDLKNQLTGQYPLDRGIANYMHALMDCYVLERTPHTLQQLAWIIRHTVHPRDDVDARDLANVEDRWFYVVFLQALCRFLELKAENKAFDTDFSYARDSLLTYADWMVEHEHPYLEKPEVLEFPNHTWTAQDLRKANVLFAAALWSPDDKAKYTQKALSLVDYVADSLKAEPSRHYTRILALLMQNIAPTKASDARLEAPIPERGDYQAVQPVTLVQQLGNLSVLLWRALRQLKPAREITAIRRLLPDRHTNRDLP